MPKLDCLRLRSADIASKSAFYVGILGMRQIGEACFCYADAEMSICFEEATSNGAYMPGGEDLYWKIAISVPDLDLAYQQLKEKGISIAPPRQFRDVGYLTHIADPEGFGIELIQHVFEGETAPGQIDPLLLGGGPCVNLLTLRCHDIESVNSFCIELGMRPLSIQPVDPYGFTLYFYAFTSEQPPKSDLKDVVNRGWTYRRPYTVLEVQHLHNATAVNRPVKGAAGYDKVFISGISLASKNMLGLVSGSD